MGENDSSVPALMGSDGQGRERERKSDHRRSTDRGDGQERELERKSDRRFTDREEAEMALEQADALRLEIEQAFERYDKAFRELVAGMGEMYHQWRRVVRENLYHLAGLKPADESVVSREDSVEPD